MRAGRKLFYFAKYVLPNPRKFVNFFAIELSMRLKKAKPWGYPHTMMIEPTNFCNLQCPLCPTGKGQLGRKVKTIEFDDFKKVIDDAGRYVVHLRMFGWGEPLLHKDLFQMIKYAKQKKMFVNIHTNAFFLTKENVLQMVESGMDELNISLDGASQETYSKYRRQGNFQTTINNIKILTDEKKKRGTKYPVINLQFIVMKHNEHEIGKIKEIAKELGVNYLHIKTVKVDTVEEAKQYLPSAESMRRYNVEGQELVKVGTKKNLVCKMLWTEATIWSNGDVVPCCYDFSGKYILGNAFRENFTKIWKSEKFENFRKQFLKDLTQIPLCKVCPRTGSGSETLIEDIKVKQ